MRIVGEIAHPIIKITVLLMNMKYSIKMELGMMEQTFKIRESDYVSKLADIERIVDPVFLDDCIKRFEQMNENYKATVFDKTFTNQLLEFTKSLNEWIPKEYLGIKITDKK